jgi:NADH-quinone oxidoreductase subunit H
MDLTLLLDKTVLILVLFGVTLFIAMYSTYAERKVAAFLQDRIGPDRAGPFGILQPLADGVKMFMKEEIIPNAADKVLFIIGPGIAMLTALMTSAVIPWGKDLTLFDRTISLQVADINIGILYIFGVVSLGVYGIMIGGWASNNKFALAGCHSCLFTNDQL